MLYRYGGGTLPWGNPLKEYEVTLHRIGPLPLKKIFHEQKIFRKYHC
jgi:peptidyl-tRNA hydrolase